MLISKGGVEIRGCARGDGPREGMAVKGEGLDEAVIN